MPTPPLPSKMFAALYDRLNQSTEAAGVREWRAGLLAVIGRGCNPNRETLATIEASGMAVESVHRQTVPKAPRTENEAILGVARAGA